jgi:hypothetical protein
MARDRCGRVAVARRDPRSGPRAEGPGAAARHVPTALARSVRGDVARARGSDARGDPKAPTRDAPGRGRVAACPHCWQRRARAARRWRPRAPPCSATCPASTARPRPTGRAGPARYGRLPRREAAGSRAGLRRAAACGRGSGGCLLAVGGWRRSAGRSGRCGPRRCRRCRGPRGRRGRCGGRSRGCRRRTSPAWPATSARRAWRFRGRSRPGAGKLCSA